MAATGTTKAKPPSVEAIFEARVVVLVGPASGRPSSTWIRVAPVSSGCAFMLLGLLGVVEQAIDAPCELALEGTERLGPGASSSEPSLSERLCPRADAQLGDRDPVQRGIELPVAATVEPVSVQLA
jgi:hypothetical protein